LRLLIWLIVEIVVKDLRQLYLFSLLFPLSTLKTGTDIRRMAYM